MSEYKWVKANNDEGRVGLFEQHPDHPDGEVFVAGEPVKVALTSAVKRKLKDGELIESGETEPKSFSAQTEEEMEKAKLKTQTEDEEEDEGESSSPFMVGGRPVSSRGRPKKG